MRVAKWGNSLAVRLPKKLVEELDLKEDDEIELSKVSKGVIAIEKIEKLRAFLERMKQYDWQTPPGYKFDRDEANER